MTLNAERKTLNAGYASYVVRPTPDAKRKRQDALALGTAGGSL